MMEVLAGWEHPDVDEEPFEMTWRGFFVESVRRYEYEQERNWRIVVGVWWDFQSRLTDARKHETLTPREASLFDSIEAACEQLADATIAKSAPKWSHAGQRVHKEELPQDVYRRWELATLVLLSLWNPGQDVLTLAIELDREPEALARIGLSREMLPPILRKRLIQARTFIIGPNPSAVDGVPQRLRSQINATYVRDVLNGKADFVYPEIRRLARVEAEEARKPESERTTRRGVMIIEDEPALTVEGVQERVEAIRRSWREQGIEDDIWQF